MDRFPKDIEEQIKNQGWFVGRQYGGVKERPKDFDIFPAAETILSEFEGLRIGISGPGQECATSDINFDPSYGDGMSKEVHAESKQKRLYPIAGVHNAHQTMFVDESGNIYLYFDCLVAFASSLDEAIVKLLRGIK